MGIAASTGASASDDVESERRTQRAPHGRQASCPLFGCLPDERSGLRLACADGVIHRTPVDRGKWEGGDERV